MGILKLQFQRREKGLREGSCWRTGLVIWEWLWRGCLGTSDALLTRLWVKCSLCRIASAVPASTGKNSDGVGRRHPEMILSGSLSVVSSHRVCARSSTTLGQHILQHCLAGQGLDSERWMYWLPRMTLFFLLSDFLSPFFTPFFIFVFLFSFYRRGQNGTAG